jgi:hypothetical protein
MHIGDESLALSPDVKTACIDRSTLADAPAGAGQSWPHALATGDNSWPESGKHVHSPIRVYDAPRQIDRSP